MPTDQINIVRGDKVSQDTDYRDSLPVNMYAVNKQILGAVGYMLCYPGLTLIEEGQGIDRAANYNERFSQHYRVSGTRLVRLNENDSVDNLGEITGTKQASMPYSFNTQAIITDGKMWLYSPSGGLVETTDPDLGSPIDGVWVDSYYFLTDGEYLYHTDLTDESSIDPLKFATSEFSPDPTKGLALTQDNKVAVFNRYSLEYFVNVATANFAFQRVETRAQKIGIVATHAKCESGGNFFIVGGRREESLGVHVIGLGENAKVSTREIDKLLAEYSEPDLADIRMESREEDNNFLILIHLPNETLLFNETISKTLGSSAAWSILKTDIAGTTPYRGINGAFDANRGYWVYGDKYNSNIGKLDNTTFGHYGEAIEWELTTPLIKLEEASIDQLEAETIPGHNIANDASVAISITYDGLTYGKEWFQLYSDPHDYGKRFIINRLGHIENYFGLKLRAATTSRMSFAAVKLTYG